MKKQFPQAVSSAILKQNKLLKNTWVIVVVGIPRDVMPPLKNTLLESSGVTGFSDTNQTDKSGRWNILVKELNFKSIRKRLSSKIQEWIRALPSEIQATIPDSFPPPKVYQKNGFDDDDDDDSSYGLRHPTCRPVPKAMHRSMTIMQTSNTTTLHQESLATLLMQQLFPAHSRDTVAGDRLKNP